MSESVLIVAFDGMDRERIKTYGLEHVTLEHFGRIDNHTGVKSSILVSVMARRRAVLPEAAVIAVLSRGDCDG